MDGTNGTTRSATSAPRLPAPLVLLGPPRPGPRPLVDVRPVAGRRGAPAQRKEAQWSTTTSS